MDQEIKQYYDQLAWEYDSDRFGNSYGRYIDTQEKRFLASFFRKNNNDKILDSGCGTGRHLNFATHGIDFSSEMLAVARKKFPEKQLLESSIIATPFSDDQFNCVFSFHVIMHLDATATKKFITENHRITETGGKLIFDFPSKKRRNVIGYKTTGWHGSNAFSTTEIKEMLGKNWNLQQTHGILLLPIHHFPKRFRRFFISFDYWLCKSFLKEFASYIIVIASKK